jgi:hypothetical protein
MINKFQFKKMTSMFNFVFLMLGLLVGVLATYFLVKGKLGFGKSDITTIQTHTIVERIERVFKVVTAEGHYAEIYDYTNTSHLLTIIPSTKKALVIVNAKVLMGYDFKKMKMEVNEVTKKISILEFPSPEILSIEPDMKYYNLENGLFNKFDNDDLTQLQREAKSKITSSVEKSDLPKIAQKQMQTMLAEIAELGQYQLVGGEKINNQNIHYLPPPKP